MLLRTALMLVEATLAIPSPKAVTGLLGRIVGLLDQSKPRAFRAQLEELSARVAAQDNETAATLSLDEARQRRSKPTLSKKRAA
jgi:hypothetical protein